MALACDELQALRLKYSRSVCCVVDTPPPPEVEDWEAHSVSRWTPARMRACIWTLPAATAYPELTARAADVLELWHARFSLKVWTRFAKVVDSGVGRTNCTPRVLKEFNESAPVLSRLLQWVDEAQRNGDPPVGIVDLCSGFGFLAMFASELLPKEAVERIYLVDKVWPNRNIKGSKGGGISTEHIYDFGAWRIPLVTLQVDITRSREVRDLALHVIRDPWPTLLCGIHLCGLLSLRAIQLFNDGVNAGCGVTGLILSPCCLPTKQQKDLKYAYECGGHRFTAAELHATRRGAGKRENAFQVYQRHLMECIQALDKSFECLGGENAMPEEGDREHTSRDNNVFFYARAPFKHAGESAGVGVDFGRPVVVEGKKLSVDSRPIWSMHSPPVRLE